MKQITGQCIQAQIAGSTKIRTNSGHWYLSRLHSKTWTINNFSLTTFLCNNNDIVQRIIIFNQKWDPGREQQDKAAGHQGFLGCTSTQTSFAIWQFFLDKCSCSKTGTPVFEQGDFSRKKLPNFPFDTSKEKLSSENLSRKTCSPVEGLNYWGIFLRFLIFSAMLKYLHKTGKKCAKVNIGQLCLQPLNHIAD